MEKEMTKVTVAICMGCKTELQVLCNETANILSARCPDCYLKFKETNPKKGEKKRKILVVDNESHIVHLLKLILDPVYDVTGCYSARECLRLIDKDKPDLITTEVVMAGINGYELCHALKQKKKTRDIPVVFISKKGQMNDKLHAIDVGADDYITKPFDPTEVLRRIKLSLAMVIRE